jgi:anthranilate synthase component 2
MNLRILLIDNNDSFTYNLAQLIEEVSICELTIRANDAVSTEDAGGYDKIIFSPGPGIPSEFPLMNKIIHRWKGVKPILGICLGHQAIAEFFGGMLINLPCVSHGIQRKIKIIDPDDYLFSDLPFEITVGLYHSWAVNHSALPSELKLTAIDADGIVMALAHKRYDIRGVQFHPESYMTDGGTIILKNWLENVNRNIAF